MSLKTIVGTALAVLVATGATPIAAGTPEGDGKQRIAFHVNEAGDEYWESVLGNVENLREELGPANTEVEVVAHGKGLGLVMATNTALAGRMKQLAEQGVVFDACENTMRTQNVTTEQLLPFATTVDSGVAHLVRRQEQGWSYVKP